MPDLAMSDNWVQQWLQMAIDFLFAGGGRVHLYQNNLTPNNATVLSEFNEADFPGYTPVSLENVEYTTDLTAHVATVLFKPVGFLATGTSSGNQIYGYFVTNDDDDALLWSQRGDPVPIDMSANMATCSVVAQHSLQDKQTV